MTLKKLNIIKNIKNELNISRNDSSELFESFLMHIKQASNDHDIKISNFGTFSYTKTPKRLGRNPKTKKTYIIEPRRKLSLRVSNHVRRILNWITK